MVIVKFECGCIGFLPDKNGMSVMIHTCEHPNEVSLWSRDMKGDSYEPVSEEQQYILFDKMATLVAEGYKLRKLKNILNS